MLRRLHVAATAAVMILGATSMAFADPIEGRWRVSESATAQIAPCGAEFCIRLVSGQHSGKQIGQLRAAGGGSYSGTVTDPNDDRTYTGAATLSGNELSLRGCVLVFCRTQNWTRE